MSWLLKTSVHSRTWSYRETGGAAGEGLLFLPAWYSCWQGKEDEEEDSQRQQEEPEETR